MLYKLKCYSIISTYNKTKPFALRALINKDSLIPLIFLLPNFFSNKVFSVFLAEPVSDILAAAATTITFLTLFNSILKKETK